MTRLLKVEIEMGNAAFEGCEEQEASRILSEAAYKLANGDAGVYLGEKTPLRDINGNTVGYLMVVEDDDDPRLDWWGNKPCRSLTLP